MAVRFGLGSMAVAVLLIGSATSVGKAGPATMIDRPFTGEVGQADVIFVAKTESCLSRCRGVREECSKFLAQAARADKICWDDFEICRKDCGGSTDARDEGQPKTTKSAGPPSTDHTRLGSDKVVSVKVQGRTGSDGLAYGVLGVRISKVAKGLSDALGLPRKGGAIISEIVPGGAAANADIRNGDIVLSIDGRFVKDVPDLVRIIRSYAPDTEIELATWRPANGSQTIIDELSKLAVDGDQEASYGLAQMFEDGYLAEKNLTEAIRYYRLAADHGHAVGAAKVGLAYENGAGGLEKNQTEAVRWYRKGAERGNAYAMYRLGVAYQEGSGVSKDLAEAARWYQQASDKGNNDATTNLAWLYAVGRGVAKNDTTATSLYEKAATAGEPYAKFNYGMRLYGGVGIQRDEKKAAQLVIEGIRKAGPQLAESVFKDAKNMGRQTRRWLQRCLRDAGVYDGKIDGQFGPGVKRALQALAKQS